MQRRGFLGALTVGVLGVFGIKASVGGYPTDGNGLCVGNKDFTLVGGEMVPSFVWLREELEELAKYYGWQTYYSHVDCGAGTCPPGPVEEGIRVLVQTPKHAYRIVAKENFLDCSVHEHYDVWAEGVNGKRTVATWHRIVEDIMRLEKQSC